MMRFITIVLLLFFSVFPLHDSVLQVVDLSLAKDTLEKLPRIDAGEKTKKLDILFNELCTKYKFNGVMLVAQNGKIIYENAKGFENYKQRDSLNNNSIFQLASVTKQFTASAIMLLHDQGKLDFDDTIQKFFPRFPYKKITIRNLLTHRAGLAKYEYFTDIYINCDKPLNNQDLVEMMSQKKPHSYYPPDKRYHYSNTGYAILAAIVEQVSQMSYSDFLKKNIFERLKMKNTYVNNIYDSSFVRPTSTHGYFAGSWREVPLNHLDGVVGDKGVYSTVEDMFKYDQALYTDTFIKQSTLTEAFTPSNKQIKGIKNYGFGWRTLTFDSLNKIVYHGGWWRGYNSLFMRVLSDKSTIILLTNRVNKVIFRQYPKILEILYSTPQNQALDETAFTEGGEDASTDSNVISTYYTSKKTSTKSKQKSAKTHTNNSKTKKKSK